MYKPCFECGGSTHKYEQGGGFEPHKMFNPETGEAYDANTMDEHLEMAEMGYLHEEEMKQMQQQRKAFGGMVNKTLKEKYKTGGSSAMQNQDINDYAKNRTGMLKNFMANSAKQQIAKEEAMNFYDQMQSQQQFNWGGFNNKAFWSPDDYLTRNQENVNLINMYGTQANKTKQGVSDAFGRIGNMAYDIIKGYDPYNTTTKIKTKIMKEYRPEYRAAKKDYRQDVRDWRNDIQNGMGAGAPMPQFNFTPGGMDLTAQYGMEVPYDQYGGNFTPYEDVSGMLPTYALAGTTPPDGGNPKYAWDYGDDPNKGRSDAAAQRWFQGFDAVPDSYLYKDASLGINSRDDYERIFTKSKSGNTIEFDWAAADAYKKRKNQEYYKLPHSEKIKYDPEAVRRLPNGEPVRDKDGNVVKGKAGLDYNDKGEYKKGAVKSKTNTSTGGQGTTGTKGQTSSEAAEKQLKGDTDKSLVQDESTASTEGGTGNVKYDDEFPADGSSTNTTTTTTDGKGNVFVPRQSWQLGPGSYRDGIYSGFGQAPPMIAYNPENTYLDYYKHRGRGLFRPDKTVMKFSHFAPGAMPNMTTEQINQYNQQMQNQAQPNVTSQGAGQPSVDDIIARETQGMSRGDARKMERNIRRANRQGMLEDYMTGEERGVNAGPDAAPTQEEIKKAQEQNAADVQKKMQEYSAKSLTEFEEKNPNATEEEKRAFLEAAQADMRQKMAGVRPAQSYTGSLTDFLRENDPNDILTPSAYDQSYMIKRDAEGNEYFRYPGTSYVYKTEPELDEKGEPTGKSTFTAVDDPETLENFRNMYPSRSTTGAYYGYDPVKGQTVPRADYVPNFYDEEGNEITSWESDSELGRKDEEFIRRTAGPGYENIKREDYADEQDYYNALAIPDTPFTADEAAALGMTRYEGDLKPFTSEAERKQQELEQKKQDNPRQFISPSQGMADLTSPEKGTIGAFTKETRSGDRKFDWRDMRKEGFNRKEIKDMKRQVKAYDDNVELTGNPEFAMNEIERAYEDANKSRTRRFMGKSQYGGVPMYNPGGVTPEPGAGMVPVEGLDMSQSVFSPMMDGMNQNMPTMPYAQPQQYTVSDNMGGEGTPLDMPIINGPTPEQKKWAETTMKKTWDRFGLKNKQWAKYLPAAGQAAAGIGRALTEPNNEAELIRRTDAMSTFTPDRTWRAGADAGMNAFNPVGVTPAISSPVQYTGGAYGQYGGQFRQGGTYMLSDDDIRQVLAMGGSIEYLD